MQSLPNYLEFDGDSGLDGRNGFNDTLLQLQEIASAPLHSSRELAEALKLIYDKVVATDFYDLDVNLVTGSAQSTMRSLFDLRIRLRDRIETWELRGFVTDEVEMALRNVFRVLRYASDIFGELAIDHARPQEGEDPFKAFSGPHGNVMVNRSYGTPGDLTFEAGDVLLVRGGAHNSAAIARIGDIDSQFSHVGMVYVDEVGKRYCVEAIIEEGSIVRPLEEMLLHGNVRAVLFRHRNRELAQRAAQIMHDHVQRSLDGRIPHIPYDFSMRLKGEKQLFCSKLIRLAYMKASEGAYVMPAYPTKLGLKNRDFVDRIGVMVKETFAPGDMELETDFDLVAEWRDYRFTSRLRLQDMVMLQILEWMEKRNYKFKESFPISLIATLGKMSAYLSSGAKELLSSVFPVIPQNMQRKTIAAVIMLHKTAEPILEKMVELEEAHIMEHGHQLHPRDVVEEVERIRQAEGRRIGYLVRPWFS